MRYSSVRGMSDGCTVVCRLSELYGEKGGADYREIHTTEGKLRGRPIGNIQKLSLNAKLKLLRV